MNDTIEYQYIPSAELPHTTRLYSTYIQNFFSLVEYYSYPPTIESVRKVAGEVHPDLRMRRNVADVLRKQNRAFGSDVSTEASLERFAAGAAVIVAGQQASLFSGPAYTIYKALHTLRIANDLAAAGTPTVAVFWLATEDHDLAEVNHSFWFTKRGVERLELPQSVSEGPGLKGARVGEIPLGNEINALVDRATDLLEGPAAAQIGRALHESYGPGDTYGSAFGKFLARVFAGRGLILIDPLSPELQRMAAPVYRAALEQHAEIADELIDRGKTLEKSGYHAQVKVVEHSTLLFISANGKRTPLISSDTNFALDQHRYSRQQLETLLAESPQFFSPSALLRPIVQDTLLGSAGIIAGPAEVAYYAQASVVYSRILGRMPVILPRATFTLVPPHLARLMRKYKLELADFFKGRPTLRKKMERDSVPPELAELFDEGEKSLREMFEAMRKPISNLDATLNGSLENAESKMLYHLTSLRERVARAMAFRSSVLDGHERQLVELLYPNEALQERSLCLLPMLASLGMSLLDELLGDIPTDATTHQVIYL